MVRWPGASGLHWFDFNEITSDFNWWDQYWTAKSQQGQLEYKHALAVTNFLMSGCSGRESAQFFVCVLSHVDNISSCLYLMGLVLSE